MNKFISSLCAASVLCMSSTASFATTFSDEQKVEIESIIAEYVSNHPEIIIQSMKNLEKQEKQKTESYLKTIADSYRNNANIPSKGSAKAKHYIIDFYDYNCGYCKVMEPLFDKALKDFDVQVIYVNLPVIKEESRELAIFGQAIYLIDKDKYFKYHQIFMSPGRISSDEESLRKVCKDIDVDFDAVVEKMKTGEAHKQINQNLEDGMKLKISGTPYLVIDGEVFRGAITNYNVLKEALKE